MDWIDGPFRVHRNPSHQQFLRLIANSRYGVLRGQLKWMGDFYVWDAAQGVHDDTDRHLDGERVAMNQHLLVAYLGQDDADEDDADNPQRATCLRRRPADR